MPDYTKSKIYMLRCDDGYYYYGSTINDLRFRLKNHKSKATNNMNRRLYQHINNNWDQVQIILVEEYACENREQLLKKENEYILQHKEDPFCLNISRTILSNRERIDYNLAYNKRYEETHQSYQEWKRQYHRNYMREYRKSKKTIENKDDRRTSNGNDAV